MLKDAVQVEWSAYFCVLIANSFNIYIFDKYMDMETGELEINKIKNVKRREDCYIYLTHILTLLERRELSEKMKYVELSANTVAFISYRFYFFTGSSPLQ